jgi:hypothetical protein
MASPHLGPQSYTVRFLGGRRHRDCIELRNGRDSLAHVQYGDKAHGISDMHTISSSQGLHQASDSRISSPCDSGNDESDESFGAPSERSFSLSMTSVS